MENIYIQLQINTDSTIDSLFVWVVYTPSNSIYKVFPEKDSEEAHVYRNTKLKQQHERDFNQERDTKDF